MIQDVTQKLVVANPCKDLRYRSPEEASSELYRGSKFESKKQKISFQEWIKLGEAKWGNDLHRIPDWKRDVLNISEVLKGYPSMKIIAICFITLFVLLESIHTVILL